MTNVERMTNAPMTECRRIRAFFGSGRRVFVIGESSTVPFQDTSLGDELPQWQKGFSDSQTSSESARGLAQSKSWRPFKPAMNSRSVLDCASPLALCEVALP